MDISFEEFHDKALNAASKGKGLKMPRYGKNLRYNADGIYSYKTKIADLDFGFRTIRQRGYWSPTSSKHYNYAKRMLEICYDFKEDSPAPLGGPAQYLMTPTQNLSYHDHT
jgi:hypothetical protein